MRRDVFQAIADPNRRAIVNILAKKRLTIGEVSQQFDISQPAISKHMKILVECDLISIEQQGRERYCTAKLESLAEVSQWVEQYRAFWNKKLDALEMFIKKDQSETEN